MYTLTTVSLFKVLEEIENKRNDDQNQSHHLNSTSFWSLPDNRSTLETVQITVEPSPMQAHSIIDSNVKTQNDTHTSGYGPQQSTMVHAKETPPAPVISHNRNNKMTSTPFPSKNFIKSERDLDFDWQFISMDESDDHDGSQSFEPDFSHRKDWENDRIEKPNQQTSDPQTNLYQSTMIENQQIPIIDRDFSKCSELSTTRITINRSSLPIHSFISIIESDITHNSLPESGLINGPLQSTMNHSTFTSANPTDGFLFSNHTYNSLIYNRKEGHELDSESEKSSEINLTQISIIDKEQVPVIDSDFPLLV